MQNPIDNAGIFLINAVFDSYVFLLLVRVILAAMRANYFNPVTQFVVKLTQPLVGPLRRVIPNFRNLEVSTLLLAVLFEFIKYGLLILLLQLSPRIEGLVLLTTADLLRAFLDIFFYAILIQAVFSWVQQGYSPVNELLMKITAPVLAPFHRIIPLIGGIDITPVFAMIVLQTLIILVVGPLSAMGQMSLG
jgi:YggT family protein